MKLLATLSLLLVSQLLCAPVHAAVYKCVYEGKIIFSEQPCTADAHTSSGQVDIAESAGFASAQSGAYDSTQWLQGASRLSDSEELAAEKKAVHMVYFYADWCGYCKRLEQTMFASAQFRQDTRPVVKVRINLEQSSNQQALNERFGVNGYPSIYVKDPGQQDYRQVYPFRDKVMVDTASFTAAVLGK